ncbi:putative toxin-antitoxin system toxin component, PIN family [Roseateles amylovorans]|uniref:Toxin-antitoxin system toxin component, PIN family n=1 Tax=Roseateles amylovorans TaxID=2978473 RepID=A0ABY6B2B3_9BURK|nr:putative toxin-antitoxin system toxin component, PIN family [Roseateles amylovorans]UXH77658.1 putative toxin-antitoxin system toxin component, PIN family [Roseateles amylovorans]
MASCARWVVDTNVLVSAFIGSGTPARVIEAAVEEAVLLFTSRVLLDELEATLGKKKLARYVSATGMTPAQLVAHYRRLCTLVTARRLAHPMCRDADDDAVLACALAARADLIVTGDDDLLSMKHFNDIPIVTAAQAIHAPFGPR